MIPRGPVRARAEACKTTITRIGCSSRSRRHRRYTAPIDRHNRGVKTYNEAFEALAHIYLEDSYVLSITRQESALRMEIEAGA